MSKTVLAGMSAMALDPFKRGRVIATALGVALMLVWAGPASAQQAKCLAGKTKCMSKKATGLLKCEAAAETPGKPTDPNAGGCVTKTKNKFDGTPDPAKGCFEKLENKNPNDCVTVDDTAAAEAAVDSCTGALVAAIDPPPTTQSKCGAGKKKCVSKFLAALLKCQATAQTPGKPTDQSACIDKATTKYTGGPDPTKGCFAKLEAKNPNDCDITGDSGTLQGLAQDCVADLTVVVTTPTTTTSSTAAPTTTSMIGATTTTSTTTTTTIGTVLKAALLATGGRFNYAGLGVTGANTKCNQTVTGTHACTITELYAAEAAGDLVGLKDIGNNVVTSFWAIDPAADPLQQCNDDTPMTGSGINWEYPTAHTLSKGSFVNLTNGTGDLDNSVTMNQQCNFAMKTVGCCL